MKAGLKILFSNPPWWMASDDGTLRMGIRAGSRWPFTRHAVHQPDSFRFGGYLPFPFFMGYAASHTKADFPHAEVILRDSVARGESYEAYFAAVAQMAPDWLFLETATPAWKHDEQLITFLWAAFPKMRLILGGTLDCDQADAILSRHLNVAAIVRGEYDKQVSKVIRGEAQGLLSHDLLTVEQMNAAPDPMFDEECATHYADGCPKGQKFPQLQVWTSRGCPYRCCFCVWPAVMTGNDPDGTKPRAVRSYSPEYLERFLTARLKVAADAGQPYQSIYLDDDTFNLTNKHVEAIAPVMKRINLPWSAMCRADTLKPENWQLMFDSGCFGVKIGCESGSQDVIDTVINKHLNLHDVEFKWLPLLKKIGFTVHTTWTEHAPGETEIQRRMTHEMIARLYRNGLHDTHQLSSMAVHDGTPLHTMLATGPLRKYPGLKAEAGYQPTSDGQLGIEKASK